MPKGERMRGGEEECRLGALWHNLSLSPSLTARSFITSPVTAEQWPGAPRIPKATPAPTSTMFPEASDITKQHSSDFILHISVAFHACAAGRTEKKKDER